MKFKRDEQDLSADIGHIENTIKHTSWASPSSSRFSEERLELAIVAFAHPDKKALLEQELVVAFSNAEDPRVRAAFTFMGEWHGQEWLSSMLVPIVVLIC